MAANVRMGGKLTLATLMCLNENDLCLADRVEPDCVRALNAASRDFSRPILWRDLE